MKTDEMIEILVSRHRPVDGSRLTRSATYAVAAGFAVALASVVLAVGLRADLLAAALDGRLWAKTMFTLLAVAVAAPLYLRLARPGQYLSRWLWLPVIPLVALLGPVTFELVQQPLALWPATAFGRHWLACLLLIPSFSVLPFVILVAALQRQGAPTDLTGAGAATGMLAASIAAVAYASHCTDDAASFVAVWYVAAIALAAGVGAVIVPRLVRW